MKTRDKYRVVRKIDAGGMAEVFEGIAESIEGFEKAIAIKRVLPHLAENKKFLAMFLDEARLSLRMNHANVVHVFEIGQAGGTYFIVMEYVDGANLRKVMSKMRERDQRIPVELAIYITIEICRGLGYAHGLEDGRGENLGIVHRDVSPPNILISKQGEVKLVDFGLAKATSQLEQTDPGVVKGKFAYLSPEAAWGKTVDKRTDIFACGIILFELLTGKRLFLGETDIETVKLVRRAEVPSICDLNPLVTEELEKIVRRALAFDERDRYQSCDDLAEDLAGYLFSKRLKVTGFDLKRLVESILVDEKEVEVVGRHSIIDQLIQEELARFASIDVNFDNEREDSPINVAPTMLTGKQPLDPFVFEDPRGWDSELQVGGTNSPLPVAQYGEWRESGLYVTETRVENKPGAPNLAESLEGHDSLEKILEGEAGTTSQNPLPEVSKSGGKVAIGLAVLMGSAIIFAIIALVMGWIP